MIAEVNPNQYVPTLGQLDPNAFRYANTIQATNISHLYDAVKAASPIEQDKLKLLREELAFKREQLSFDKRKLRESARQKNMDFALDYAQVDIGYTKTKGNEGTYDLYGADNIFAGTKAFQPLTNEISAARSGMFSSLNGDPFSFDVSQIDAYKNRINNLKGSPTGQYFNRMSKAKLSILKGIDDGTNNKAAALAIQETADELNNLDPESETYLQDLKALTEDLEGYANINYNVEDGKESFDNIVTNGINGVYDLRGRSVTSGNHDYLQTGYVPTGGELGGEPVLFTADHPNIIAMANLISSDNRALFFAQNEILPGSTLVDREYMRTGQVNPEGHLALREYLANTANGYSGEESITGVSKSNAKYRQELETKADVDRANETDGGGSGGDTKPVALEDILGFKAKNVPESLNDTLLSLYVGLDYTREQVKAIYYDLISEDERIQVTADKNIRDLVTDSAESLGFPKPNWGSVGIQRVTGSENWTEIGGDTDAQETTTQRTGVDGARQSVGGVFRQRNSGTED